MRLGSDLEPTWCHLGAILNRLGALLGPSWTVLERSVKMMLRSSQFFEDVPSEMAIFRRNVKYIKNSVCPLLGDVSGETLIFVKIDVAKTSIL